MCKKTLFDVDEYFDQYLQTYQKQMREQQAYTCTLKNRIMIYITVKMCHG